ncbi:hypothetical protein SNOG_20048 [Parastagonospora nodorum SN15]|uniref:Uncharacterized protein n=1 Tax=Phaeosphaeria nodorum (strain SN15 / ATCC MYA-4574 / FGSC 10173) TaxID=321614 RepID=A9JX48_PHANO|nr:hypothetical protein SNOG_20048 [Parastagonospora nodorum SN15]EDP89904.1 hypothetical protein SNOG_20048 [Parastagonospora nodorum SN15]
MPMCIGFAGPPSSIRIVRINIDVTKASRNRPRAVEMDGSRVVATPSGPGSSAAMKPDAAIPAIICEIMV